MNQQAELLTTVDRWFDQGGGAALGWEDPHRNRSPAEDEYSRVTDPQKWRIVGARADAWLKALGALDLARVEIFGRPRSWPTRSDGVS